MSSVSVITLEDPWVTLVMHVKSGRYHDDLNNQEGLTCQCFFQEGEMEEFVAKEEEYSHQFQEAGSSTARSGHSSEHNTRREDSGERGIC